MVRLLVMEGGLDEPQRMRRRLAELVSRLGGEWDERYLRGEALAIALRVPANADYRFVVRWFESDWFEIAAERIGTDANPDEAFWYLPFEWAEFGSAEEALEKMAEYLDTLARQPSRIVQTRGWLWFHFRLEVRRDGGWSAIHAMSMARFSTVPAPPAPSKYVIWWSPPLGGG